MRRTLLACAAALCVTGIGVRVASTQDNARPRTSFGRVIDAGTGRPVEGVSIVVPSAGIGTKTGSNGVFRLNRVPSATTEIEFRHPCYFAVRVVVPVRADLEIDVGLPFDNASLQRAGCGGLGARSKRDTSQ
jgi:hypothetical protein